MAPHQAFRFECCQQMLVALMQEEELRLEIGTTPVRRRDASHVMVVALMTKEGAIRATCRHEVQQHAVMHWVDYVTKLMGLVLYH